jgi:chromate transporter
MTQTLIALAVIFSELSLLAFGGGNAILPEMRRQVVDLHHWMTAEQFGALFALAQAAPGPNLMVAPLVGWHVAGFVGLAVTSIAQFGPSSLLTAFALSAWERFRDRPWRRIVQAGLAPVTVGLVSASAIIIARASDTTWGLAAITLAVAAVTAKTKLHPLVALTGGAVLGLCGLGTV